MPETELLGMTISELAPKIQNKEVSPVEIVDAHLSRVGLLLLHDQPKDGRLAAPVGPHQPDPLPPHCRHRGIEKEDLGTVRLRDRIELNHAPLPGRPGARPETKSGRGPLGCWQRCRGAIRLGTRSLTQDEVFWRRRRKRILAS